MEGPGLSWSRKCPLSTLFTITGLQEEAQQAHKCRTSELAGALEATASAPPSTGSPQEALGLRPHPTTELESQLCKIPRRFSGLRSTSVDLIGAHISIHLGEADAQREEAGPGSHCWFQPWLCHLHTHYFSVSSCRIKG